MQYLRFETQRNAYLYDNNTGYVIPDDGVASLIIDNFQGDFEQTWCALRTKLGGISKEALREKYLFIENCIRKGMFTYSNYRCIDRNITLKEVKEQCFSLNHASLVLIVTERCNLRCKYCIYSDHYPKEISYSNQDMSISTAKQAVDHFVDVVSERRKRGYTNTPSIGFYGGEPLLRFSLIKEVVEYAYTKLDDVGFSITTNATIMTDEIAELLAVNNFSVILSMDGDESNHDRNRVFANNQPSHSLCLENAKKLQIARKNHGCKTPVTFNCCFDNYTDLERVVDFFSSNHEQLSPYNVMYSRINPFDSTYYEFCDSRFSDGSLKRMDTKHLIDNLFVRFRNKAYGDKTASLLNLMFSSLLAFATRTRDLPMGVVGNSCMPTAKIAVSPDGTLSLCERMCKRMPIGNVNEWIDYDAVRNLLLILSDVHTNCNVCPIKRLCGFCFQQYDDIEKHIRHGFCEEEKSKRISILQNVFSIYEEGVDLIDMFSVPPLNIKSEVIN